MSGPTFGDPPEHQPDAGALWAAWERASAAPSPAAATPAPAPAFTPAPLAPSPARLPPPASIPPREWLYGTRLIRRFVSVLVAPGGVGKSALALAQAMALASGRPFLGERVHHQAAAWVLNLEDPQDELERRVAALCLLHALPREALAGRLFLDSGRARRLRMAEFEDGAIVHPDQGAMIAAARAHDIGLIVVDPFVKSHRLDENANAEIDAALSAWAEVAEAAGAAVLLVHHVRKGAVADIDAARGAKALTDAARSATLLAAMSEDEARQLSVPPAERFRYIRHDDAKANMAPRAERAFWYRIEAVSLGNATALYPAGDEVAALRRWEPPSPFAALDAGRCNQALDLIAAGLPDGTPYVATRRARTGGRWAGAVLERFGLAEGEAARVVGRWLKAGLLVEAAYRDPGQRKLRIGVRVDDAKRPTASAVAHEPAGFVGGDDERESDDGNDSGGGVAEASDDAG